MLALDVYTNYIIIDYIRFSIWGAIVTTINVIFI